LLEKRPENKAALRKRARSEVPAAASISEPKSDWMHPWEAPFFCFSGNYIPSVEGWTGALRAEVHKIIERAQAVPLTHDLSPAGKWSFGCASDAPQGWINAMGLQTVVQPSFLAIVPWEGEGRAEIPDPDWVVTDYGKEILKADSHLIPSHQRAAFKWHKTLLQKLFHSWEEGFVQAVRFRTVYIMARKHSVLAPFERISWEQWLFFQLDKDRWQPDRLESWWGDPRGPRWKHVADVPWTATGPAGERLYQIQIAPGAHRPQNGQLTPNQEAIAWLVKLLSDYPDHPPNTLPKLTKQICSAIPGLSERAFRYCLIQAQQQTGNRNWSARGRWKSRPTR
jgi:hypothetical protein